MDTILRPIVESAGYRVIASGSPEADAAEVVIVGDREMQITSGSARIVRLRSEPEPSGLGDNSIHRYDRTALIGALGRAARGKKG